MELIGRLEAKFDTQKVSEKFSKREFVIKTEESRPYPQMISIQITNDKCQLLDLYNVGEEVKVQINIKGRKWNGPQGTKYFNTIEAWRIEKFGATTTTPIQETPSTETTKDAEDLPF